MKTKKIYQKPKMNAIKIDNDISVSLMSEGTIPDNPPWVYKEHKNNPYKIDKA